MVNPNTAAARRPAVPRASHNMSTQSLDGSTIIHLAAAGPQLVMPPNLPPHLVSLARPRTALDGGTWAPGATLGGMDARIAHHARPATAAAAAAAPLRRQTGLVRGRQPSLAPPGGGVQIDTGGVLLGTHISNSRVGSRHNMNITGTAEGAATQARARNVSLASTSSGGGAAAAGRRRRGPAGRHPPHAAPGKPWRQWSEGSKLVARSVIQARVDAAVEKRLTAGYDRLERPGQAVWVRPGGRPITPADLLGPPPQVAGESATGAPATPLRLGSPDGYRGVAATHSAAERSAATLSSQASFESLELVSLESVSLPSGLGFGSIDPGRGGGFLLTGGKLQRPGAADSGEQAAVDQPVKRRQKVGWAYRKQGSPGGPSRGTTGMALGGGLVPGAVLFGRN